MTSFKSFAVVGAVLSSLLLSVSAQAQIPITITPTFNPDQFGLGMSGYGSGDITIPGGAILSSTPVELDRSFATDITLLNKGLGYDYGIGLKGFDLLIQPGDDAFTFSIELLENGNLVTPDFATDIANPSVYLGFDIDNPFPFAIDNLGTGTSTTALAPSLTFNEIAILLSSSNPTPGGIGFTTIGIQLGTVPDTASALPLLCAGLLTLWGFGVSKMNRARV